MPTLKTFDPTIPIKTIRGTEVSQVDEKGKKQILTYGLVVTELLANPNRKGAELMKCWRLAQKIVAAKEKIELTDEEFGLLRAIVEENYSPSMGGGSSERFAPFVIAQILDTLEQQYK